MDNSLYCVCINEVMLCMYCVAQQGLSSVSLMDKKTIVLCHEFIGYPIENVTIIFMSITNDSRLPV